jgi:type VI secretion system secreted protein Hcp
MTSLKIGAAGLFALAASCVMAAPAMAASDIYLKIEGIPGESADADHRGEIEVLSWSFGASQPASPRFGGAAASGRAAQGAPVTPPQGPGAVSVSKPYDPSSAKLVQACAQGKHFPKATLSVRKAGGGQQEYLTYELENVMVSSYSLSSPGGASSGGASSGGDRPMESLSLNYTKITYKTSDDKSGAGAAGKAGYDVAPAKKI